MSDGYFDGIVDNLELMKSLYPGYVMRLYVSKAKLDNMTIATLCDIQCNNTIDTLLDTCAVDNLQDYGDLSSVFGMIWRFLPMMDPTVDMMGSRDLDSRLTKREFAALADSLGTGLPFH